MNETEFHQLANATLEALYDALEASDKDGAVDVEYQDGVMTITLPSDKQYVVSKHTPTRQLWLSSPVSGGLHFSYRDEWVLADGRTLTSILSQELQVAGMT